MTSRTNNQSLNVCSACRSRKVRCDGQRGNCGACERSGFPCSYPDDLNHSSQPEARPTYVRRRGHNSCTACRHRKIKCSTETPKCGRCRQKGIECVYLGRKPRQSTIDVDAAMQSSPAQGSEASRTAPERSQCLMSPSVTEVSTDITNDVHIPPLLALRALDTFFDKISQVTVFSFLHRASIIEEHRSGTLDRGLLLAIVGIAHLIPDFSPDLNQSGAKYIDAAQTLIVSDLDIPTISRIQALVLIIQHRSFSRKFATVFMLMSLAVRSALGLRLNYENHQFPFLLRESCRRVVWSLYMIDTVLAAGYDDFSLVREGLIHIQLPCHDHNFQMDMPQSSEALYQPPSESTTAIEAQSPAALVVRILSLRQRVLQYTKVAGARELPDITSTVSSFDVDLDAFLKGLPKTFELSAYNFRLHVHMPTFVAYLKIHVTWLGVNCILYRLVLAGLKESLPAQMVLSLDSEFRGDCEQRCLSSARSMIELFDTVLRLGPATVIMDLDLAVMAYQCARILVFFYRTLRFDMAREDIDSNLNICKDFLHSRFCKSDAIAEIKNDLAALTRHCHSADDGPAEEYHDTSETASSTEPSPHILSKHSLIRQMDLKRREQSGLRPLEALKVYRDVGGQASSGPERSAIDSESGVFDSNQVSGHGLVSSSEGTSMFLANSRGLGGFDPLLFDLSLPDFDVGSASWIVGHTTNL